MGLLATNRPVPYLRVAGLVSLGALLLSAACSRDSGASTTPSAAPLAASSIGATVDASASAAVSAAPTDPPPSGTASLVIERVDSDCGTGPEGQHRLGYDVLLRTQSDGATKPGKPVQLSCPPGKRNMWEMCKRYTSCTIDSDAGADRSAVTCDKDTIVLESVPGGGTRVTAPGVSIPVAPSPMRVAPVQKTMRLAHVDC